MSISTWLQQHLEQRRERKLHNDRDYNCKYWWGDRGGYPLAGQKCQICDRTPGPNFEPPSMALDNFDPEPADQPCILCEERVATVIAEEVMDWLSRNQNALRSMSSGQQVINEMIDGLAKILVAHGARRSEPMADIVERDTGKRPKTRGCEGPHQ